MYTLKDSRVFNLGIVAPHYCSPENEFSGTVASRVGAYRFEIFEVMVLILIES